MMRAWIISIATLVFAFFFWVVCGPVFDALYIYAFEGAFMMTPFEMEVVRMLYAAWNYMLLVVVGIIVLFNVMYAVHTR